MNLVNLIRVFCLVFLLSGCIDIEEGGGDNDSPSKCEKRCDKRKENDPNFDVDGCKRYCDRFESNHIENPKEKIFFSNTPIFEYFDVSNIRNASLYFVSEQAIEGDPLICRQHCNEGNAFCEAGNINHDITSRLKRASNLFRVMGPNLIQKNDLMEIFDQTSDLCNRGDIQITDNNVVNSGDTDCIATFVSGGHTFDVAFPANFEADYIIDDGHHFLINPEISPVLLSHSLPNSLINGSLSYVGLTDEGFYTRIGQMCVFIPNQSL